MFEKEGIDVNETVDSSVTESSPVETDVEGLGQEAEKTAESLKTETADEKGPIPYERFKEKNEEAKRYKEEIEALKKKNEYWEKFEATANEVPEFAEAINDVIERLQKGELTKKEADREIKDIKADVAQKPQGDPAIRDVLFSLYNNEFEKMATKDYDSKEDIQTLGYATGKILMEKYPNAAQRFNPSYVAEAYKQARETFEGYAQRRLAKYTESKEKDEVPASKAGVSVASDVKINTREDATAYMAEALKNLK